MQEQGILTPQELNGTRHLVEGRSKQVVSQAESNLYRVLYQAQYGIKGSGRPVERAIGTLASAIHVTPRTIINATKKLEELGLINVSRGTKMGKATRINTYSLLPAPAIIKNDEPTICLTMNLDESSVPAKMDPFKPQELKATLSSHEHLVYDKIYFKTINYGCESLRWSNGYFAQAINISVPELINTVQKLESMGLIKASPDTPKGFRTYTIQPKPEGLKLIHAPRNISDEEYREVLEPALKGLCNPYKEGQAALYHFRYSKYPKQVLEEVGYWFDDPRELVIRLTNKGYSGDSLACRLDELIVETYAEPIKTLNDEDRETWRGLINHRLPEGKTFLRKVVA